MTGPGELPRVPAMAQLAALLASLQDGFELLDGTGTILDVNERFAQIVGRSRDEIVGLRPPFPWWADEGPEREFVERALTSVIEGGSGEFDLSFRRPDGQPVKVILNATRILDDDGNSSIVAIVKDVSERAASQVEREDLIHSLSAERAQLSRVLERMGRIQRFTASIASKVTEDEIVGSLLSAAQESVGSSSAAVVLLDEEGQLVIAAKHGEPDAEMVPARSSPEDQGDLQSAFRSGSSLWLEPRPGPDGPDERWGFIPIVRPTGSMGVLAVCCPEGTFTFEDRDTLETMVRQAAQALERARLYAVESRTRVTLAHVLTISDAALEWMESDDALQELLRRIRQVVGADSASLLVRENDHLKVRATDGLERIPGEQVPVPVGEGFAGTIAATREPLVAEDISRIHVVSPWLREKVRSVAGVPIVRRDEVIGVLHVGSVSTRVFDHEDVDLLNLVAARVGGALERAQLYEAARLARADAARAADRVRRLQAATAALAGAMSVEDVSDSILREAIAAVHADAGVLAVPSEDGRYLEVVSTKGKRSATEGFARRFAVDHAAAICEAYRSGESVWVPTREEWERRFPGGLWVDKPWARSIFALPLVINERRLGAIGLMFQSEGRLSRDERRLAKTFAEQASVALERARLFEDERAARETTERLQEFASALAAVAATDDVLSILVEDGRLLVGADAAWAAMLDAGTKELHAVASRGYDEETIARFDRLPLDAPMPASDAARERREIWFGSLDEFDRAYPEFPRPATPHEGGFGCLPMFDAGRRVIGVVSFQLGVRAAIDARQRSAMRAVAALAAQSLERAELYELEHAVAGTLQKSLLPGSLPDEPRVEIATRYRPGTEELDVGGDWYDVIHVDEDRIGVAIGDVVGHGLEAASAMGQLRSALRSLALTGADPGRVISGIDRFARTTAPATVATVVYAELDLGRNVVRYACAGHPPPLVVTRRHVVELMEGRTTPLAALPDAPDAQEGVHPFLPGSVLVLYSDGLIERRGEALDVGMERLRTLLANLPSDHPESLADRLIAELTGDVPQDDDVALLCLRNVAHADSISTSIPAEPSALTGLRGTIGAWLDLLGLSPETCDDLILACDEACANAIEHAYHRRRDEPIRVELRRDDDDIEIAVRDSGIWRHEPVDGDRGRGIGIMRAVMDDVDIRTGDEGTLVLLRRNLSRLADHRSQRSSERGGTRVHERPRS
jgi:PAS domain S-box-containing protein